MKKKIIEILLIIIVVGFIFIVGFTAGSLYQMEEDYQLCKPCEISKQILKQELDSCNREKERRQKYLNFYLEKVIMQK